MPVPSVHSKIMITSSRHNLRFSCRSRQAFTDGSCYIFFGHFYQSVTHGSDQTVTLGSIARCWFLQSSCNHNIIGEPFAKVPESESDCIKVVSIPVVSSSHTGMSPFLGLIGIPVPIFLIQ